MTGQTPRPQEILNQQVVITEPRPQVRTSLECQQTRLLRAARQNPDPSVCRSTGSSGGRPFQRKRGGWTTEPSGPQYLKPPVSCPPSPVYQVTAHLRLASTPHLLVPGCRLQAHQPSPGGMFRCPVNPLRSSCTLSTHQILSLCPYRHPFPHPPRPHLHLKTRTLCNRNLL